MLYKPYLIKSTFMHNYRAKFITACFGAVAALAVLTSFQQKPAKHKPVVIELFTSEGCSSCPPADLLLGKIVKEAADKGEPVYALAFHVDYWNRLGWIDSFSKKSFSERQQNYERVLHTQGAYTPQMIVNGSVEFVGSDEEALRTAIAAESKKVSPVAFTELSAHFNNGKMKVHYRADGNIDNYEVNIAIISKTVQTAVKNGENRGRLLKHTHVVRQFATLKALPSGESDFDIPAKDNVEVIAFLQERNTRVIMDAISAKAE